MTGEISYSHISGAKEMERLLLELGEEVANKLGKQAVRAGGKIIAEDAKDRVRVRTGELRDAITVTTPSRTAQDQAVALIGFRRPTSSRAHLTEFGTAHSRAFPFLRPALDSKANESLNAMGKVLARGIDREARRLAGQLRTRRGRSR